MNHLKLRGLTGGWASGRQAGRQVCCYIPTGRRKTNRNLHSKLYVSHKGRLKRNSLQTAQTQIQSHRPITLFAVILDQLFFLFSSQGPALADCLRRATSPALESFSSISALGTEVFWRWSVRSYHGCLVFLEAFFSFFFLVTSWFAGRHQRTAGVLVDPPAVQATATFFHSPPRNSPTSPVGGREGDVGHG